MKGKDFTDKQRNYAYFFPSLKNKKNKKKRKEKRRQICLQNSPYMNTFASPSNEGLRKKNRPSSSFVLNVLKT